MCYIILLLIAAIGGVIMTTFDKYFVSFCAGFIMVIFSLGLCLSCGISRLSYNTWTTEFEIQKEFVAETSFNEYTIVNIINANQQLAQFQAVRKTLGIFSPIPEEVLNIEPIKIGS